VGLDRDHRHRAKPFGRALGGIVGTNPAVYSNLKLDFGGATIAPRSIPRSRRCPWSRCRAVPPRRHSYPAHYPVNIYGETPHSAMATQITALVMKAAAMHDYVTVHTVVGESASR
jgi:hypothetical protein